MGKVIIPDDEIWAWNGSILKPNPEHFEEGHTTGATGKKPRHDQFNYTEQRRDLNLQYLLRMAGLPYDPLEVYPIGARASKNGHMYVSLNDNNKGNDPISSGKWKHEDDDKFPVGTVICNSLDNRNPSLYKGFGVWSAIDSETSINFVPVNSSELGSILGSNEVTVPLPAHSHSITVNSKDLGSKSTNTTGNHNHLQKVNNGSSGTAGNRTGGTTKNQQVNSAEYTNYSGNHNHTLSLGSHNHSASASSAGVSDPSISVKGKSINVIGWIRTE